ncbi:hypothetical protein [Opitutus sp. ER46]|uniref:hypothetical protein n=1 Tax=Opitutus sp. ER46 TaxID=2161864 RepID=UPI0011B1DBBC|nr:hypothetical protein [Opitutus sp. ER46]
MNSTSSARSFRCSVPLAYGWSHAGEAYRVTPWPDVQFERLYGDEWLVVEPTPEVLAAAGARADRKTWQAFLSFVPAHVQEFLGRFRRHRLAALQVAARCPDLVASLEAAPALTVFVAQHAGLRGIAGPRWAELAAVFERGGVYGVLEWLGLPASRQTLAILQSVVTPDLDPLLLEPLRKVLWAPQGIFALARLPEITDRDLNDACALAA